MSFISTIDNDINLLASLKYIQNPGWREIIPVTEQVNHEVMIVSTPPVRKYKRGERFDTEDLTDETYRRRYDSTPERKKRARLGFT